MPWSETDIPDQAGRVAIVTGGNGGLGLETVRQLGRKGAHVIMAARNMSKATKAAAEIRPDVSDSLLEVRNLDLASMASIEEFATGVTSTYKSIDLLFNNAGVMATPQQLTADGFELQFGTNHLGHFYLTFLLLPRLLQAPAARVVSTTSTARFSAGKYDLDNLHVRVGYKPWEAYGISKRANLHFAIELNKRLAAAGAATTAYAADPGFSKTDLQATSSQSSGGFSQRMSHVGVERMGQSAARGALPQLRAGTDPAARGGTMYRPKWIGWGDPVIGRIGQRLRKPEDLAGLWKVSEVDLNIKFDVAAMVAEAR
jgi:NAD(P)-dependent dehydrogenase (short-subunit alcohol dehydrogenase family)